MMSNTELAELRWSVRGKILDELREREIELTAGVVMTIDVMLDTMTAFDEGDRLHKLHCALNDWECQELMADLQRQIEDAQE